jgi:hypothetical protein
MKKLILALTVAAFTVGAYAGESCCPKDKEKACCPGKTAEGCTASKDKKCPAGETAKPEAPNKAETPKDNAKKS